MNMRILIIIFVLLQYISFLRICHGTINFANTPLTTTDIATTTSIPKSMKFLKTKLYETVPYYTITSSVIDLLDSNVICDQFSVTMESNYLIQSPIQSLISSSILHIHKG